MFMPNFVKIQRIDINLLIFFKKLEKLLLFQFKKNAKIQPEIKTNIVRYFIPLVALKAIDYTDKSIRNPLTQNAL